MVNKKIIYKITLLFAVFFSLIELSACSPIKKGINSMSNNEKVAEIKIGETYTMLGSIFNGKEEDRSIYYIKLLDDKTFMHISDGAQRSEEYYRADGDNKTISIMTGTYEKEGDNFVQKTYTSYQTLSFSRDIDVKKGASGKLSNFMSKNEKSFDSTKGGGVAIEKHDNYYRINSSNLKGNPSDALRISDVKLPDTVEEFLAQYNLTSDVKPQSYERTPEGQEKKAKMFDLTNFPVHREDDGTIWIGF
ncbi:MAG: hypothetical protein WAX43_08730 [Lactococcus chungangensis]